MFTLVEFRLDGHQTSPTFREIGVRIVCLYVFVHFIVLVRYLGSLSS